MPETVPVDNENNEETSQLEDPVIVVQKSHPIKRFGCGLLLVIWFTLLLTPCALFYLAANGEIRIWHSGIPDPNSHPLLLVDLVSEVDYRGLQFTRSYPVTAPADNICVQTDVSFFLWESLEDDLDTSYCDCYQRADTESSWQLYQTVTGICPTLSD